MAKITSYDIAKKAGVSQTAVSFVLNNKTSMIGEKTREKILKVVRQLDYQPDHTARSLRGGKKMIIGVALSGAVSEMNDPALSRIFSGIARSAETRNYNIIQLPLAQPEFLNRVVDAARAKMVDGLIFTVYSSWNRQRQFELKTLPVLKEINVPFVVMHTNAVEFSAPHVGMDMEQGGYSATMHLLEQNHTDIALVNAPGVYNDEFLQGYSRALEETGGKKTVYTNTLERFSAVSGYEYGKQIISENGVHRAYVIYTDQFAYGFTRALKEAGKNIPDDVALVSCGNVVDEELMYPELTSLDLKYRERGERAGEMLFGQIEGKSDVKKQWVAEPVLIVRRPSAK